MPNLLFTDVPEDSLQEILQHFDKTRTYSPYEQIIQEGAAGRELYLLEQGSALLKVGGRALGSLEVDDVFGEVGFFASGRRSAAVFAGPKGALVRILTPEGLTGYAARHPQVAFVLAKNLAHLLASKLQRTNQFLRTHVERVKELEEEQHGPTLMQRLIASLGST